MGKESEAEVRALIEKLKQHGYRIRKPGEYVKFTQYVHENTVLRFKQTAAELDYKMQDASTEALELWLATKESDLEALAEKRRKRGEKHRPKPVEPDPDDNDSLEE